MSIEDLELGELWIGSIPDIGFPPLCRHRLDEGPTSDCKEMRERIVLMRKRVSRAMLHSNVSIHVINENLHNIEVLRKYWEGIHFMPASSWKYLDRQTLTSSDSNVEPPNFKLVCLEDFPPLIPMDQKHHGDAENVEDDITNQNKDNNDKVIGSDTANSTADEKRDKNGFSSSEKTCQPLSYAQILIRYLKEAQETQKKQSQIRDQFIREKAANMTKEEKIETVRKLVLLFDDPEDE